MKPKLILFIKAISDPTRLRMLHQLRKQCCVGEIWEKLELPQNLTSHHLKVLREAGLITAEKRGMKVIYCLNNKILADNLKLLETYLIK